MIKTFIFVEDGSVDVDELRNDLGDDTMVVVYRQGSTMPTIVQPKEPVKFFLDDQDQRIYEPTKKALKSIEKCLSRDMSVDGPAALEVLRDMTVPEALKILKELIAKYYTD